MNLKKTIKNTLSKIVFFACISINLSWTTCSTISDTGTNFSPFCSINSSENSVVVWVKGSYPELSVHLSYYDGSSWSTPVKISDLETAVSPLSGIDSKGNIIVAWESIEENSRSIIVREKPFGSGWNSPLTISDSSYSSSLKLSMNSDGDVVIGWIDFQNNFVKISNKKFGNSFATPEIISSDSDYKGNLQLALDSTGNSIAMWENFDNGKIFSTHTTAGINSTWQLAYELTSSGTNSSLNLASDPSGNAIAAWTNIDSSAIIAAIFENGIWAMPTILSNDYSGYPSVALSANQYFVSWNDLNFGSILGSINSDGNWESPIQISQNQPNDSPKSSYMSGIFYTAWSDLITGEVNVGDSLESSSPTPVIISNGNLNLVGEIISSVNFACAVWESIVEADHVIQVNLD
jgi:hypothetical protein